MNFTISTALTGYLASIPAEVSTYTFFNGCASIEKARLIASSAQFQISALSNTISKAYSYKAILLEFLVG